MGAVDARWAEYRRFPVGQRHIELRVGHSARRRAESIEAVGMRALGFMLPYYQKDGQSGTRADWNKIMIPTNTSVH